MSGIKAHLAFALKVAIALIIVNAIINVFQYFGFGVINAIVYDPLKLVGLNKSSATTTTA